MAAKRKPGRDGVKYWRAVDAIEALSSASLAEVEEWDRSHYPHDAYFADRDRAFRLIVTDVGGVVVRGV